MNLLGINSGSTFINNNLNSVKHVKHVLFLLSSVQSFAGCVSSFKPKPGLKTVLGYPQGLGRGRKAECSRAVQAILQCTSNSLATYDFFFIFF